VCVCVSERVREGRDGGRERDSETSSYMPIQSEGWREGVCESFAPAVTVVP
jgi:hypothetical protein